MNEIQKMKTLPDDAEAKRQIIEIGRRRKVVGEPSTRISANCPGSISGSGDEEVNFSSA